MVEIPLKNGLVALVDDSDAERVLRHSWHARKGPRPYVQSTIKTKQGWKNTLLHRFLLQPDPEVVVDHIDCNPLNNTRANLRPATAKQNATNRRVSMGRYLGVTKIDRGFQAMVYPDGLSISLGVFDTAELAAEAYNQAALAAFAEFSTRNDVPHVPGLLDRVIQKKLETIYRLQKEINVIGGSHG